VPILVALVLLVTMLVGAAIVGSRLLYESTPMPAVSRVPFADPVAQVIQGDDGTTWASTALNDAGSFRVTGIHRVNPDGVTSTPVVTDLPPGHTSFVVLDGVIWASNDESGMWLTFDAKTGAALGRGSLGDADLRPLEPLMAYGAVWQHLFGADGVVRTDPRSGDALRIRTAPEPRNLAAGAGRVWVVHLNAPVMGIDPARNEVVAQLQPTYTPCAASVAGERVWVYSCYGSAAVDVFEPDGTSVGQYVADDAVTQYSFDYDGDVWVVETTREARVFENDEFRTVPARTRIVRLDPVTLEPLASYDAGEGIGIPERADLLSGTLASDALWLVQGEDVIRVPLALLPERPAR
jgi:hypothetical protein